MKTDCGLTVTERCKKNRTFSSRKAQYTLRVIGIASGRVTEDLIGRCCEAAEKKRTGNCLLPPEVVATLIELLRHRLSQLKAAAMSYVNQDAVVIIIDEEPATEVMDRADEFVLNGLDKRFCRDGGIFRAEDEHMM